MIDIDLVMSTNFLSSAEQVQDFPTVVTNPDASSYLTKLGSLLVDVDLYIR